MYAGMRNESYVDSASLTYRAWEVCEHSITI